MYADKLDVAVLAGLLVLVAATTFFLLQQPSPSSPCSGLAELPGQLDCFAAAANASGLAACMDAPLPDACAGLYAYRHGAIGSCASWPDAQGCAYYFFSARLQYGSVNQTDGITACRSLSNATWRHACLDRHAQMLRDSAFCHEMDVDYYRDQCLNQVSRIP